MSSWYTLIVKKGSWLTLSKQGWYHSECRCSPISLCPKSNPFYQPLLPARYPARIPGKCERLHGRRKSRKRRYRQRWSKNGQSSSEGKSGKVYFCCGRKLWVSSIYLSGFSHAQSQSADGNVKGGELWHVRSSVFTSFPVYVAKCEDQRYGS